MQATQPKASETFCRHERLTGRRGMNALDGRSRFAPGSAGDLENAKVGAFCSGPGPRTGRSGVAVPMLDCKTRENTMSRKAPRAVSRWQQVGHLCGSLC
eukprot:3368152-Amphidinium_carterae.1